MRTLIWHNMRTAMIWNVNHAVSTGIVIRQLIFRGLDATWEMQHATMPRTDRGRVRHNFDGDAHRRTADELEGLIQHYITEGVIQVMPAPTMATWYGTREGGEIEQEWSNWDQHTQGFISTQPG